MTDRIRNGKLIEEKRVSIYCVIENFKVTGKGTAVSPLPRQYRFQYVGGFTTGKYTRESAPPWLREYIEAYERLHWVDSV